MKDLIKPEDSCWMSRRSLKNGLSPIGRVYRSSQLREAVCGIRDLCRGTQRKHG